MAIPASTEIPLSGERFVDGLLSGGRWYSSGGPLTLTWGTADNPYQSYYWLDPAATAGDIQLVMQHWSNVANINFSYSGHFSNFATAAVDIAISISDGAILTDAVAVGVFPLESYADNLLADLGWTRADWAQPEGDIFANIDAADGSAEYTTYVAHHELGHALGLKHSHDGGAVGNPTFDQLGIANFDSTLHTVMSYEGNDGFGIGLYPATPMPIDVLAIQYLYGANLSHRTGNDIYVLGETGYMQTIWDAGGQDVFDASTSPAGVGIDLNDFDGSGYGYSWHGLASITAIAAGVVIEDAVGSGYDDVVLGNEVNNRISGLGGNDNLIGGAGNDDLRGGGGEDTLRGGPGDDSLFGGPDGDHLLGGGNTDVLRGAGGDDILRGGPGDDRLFGGPDGDILLGDGNTDILRGGGGDDVLRGHAGDDRLFGAAGNNNLHGGGGNDIMRGGGGADILRGGPGDDVLMGNGGHDRLIGGNHDDVLYGRAGNDVLLGNDSNDRLVGGPGDDQLLGQAGNDVLIGGGDADLFVFQPNGGHDVVIGFQDDLDLLDFRAFAFASKGSVLNLATQVGADVVFGLPGGETVELDNFDIALLGAEDIVI